MASVCVVTRSYLVAERGWSLKDLRADNRTTDVNDYDSNVKFQVWLIVCEPSDEQRNFASVIVAPHTRFAAGNLGPLGI